MKMKVEVLVANQAQLQTLAGIQFEDAQLVWDLADAYEKVEAALEKYNKTRSEYLKTDGTPNPDDPNQYSLKDPEAFGKKLQKLLDVEVPINFPKIPFAAFADQKCSVTEFASWKRLGILEKPKAKKDEKA